MTNQSIPDTIEIAVDTEYQDAHTLTVQAATRVEDGVLAVKLYRSPSVPPLPEDFDTSEFLPTTEEAYGRFCRQIVIREVALLSEGLSPVQLLSDLLNLHSVRAISRDEGDKTLADPELNPDQGEWDDERRRWRLPKIELVVIGHFLTADLGRIFGHQFYAGLLNGDGLNTPPVTLDSIRTLALVEQYATFTKTSPVVQYAALGNQLYEVHLTTRDTMLPFGRSSLDELCQTFLGLGKSDAISDDEKSKMLATFKKRPRDAYGYAIVDAVNTLLLYEEMKNSDRKIYEAFDVPEDRIPPMARTIGGRVKDFLCTMTVEFAHDSKTPATPAKIKQLMRRGGILNFHGQQRVSRFGPQTGVVHGGLLYSRSPTQFWHESPGMLRDVDISGCYNGILANMNVYWGRPVVLEPGSRAMTLAEAVEFVRARAAGDDAWFLRVTGDITGIPNTLIPSTLDAVTADNYRVEVQRARLAAFRKQLDDADEQSEGAKLFSRRIESGVITRATWLMIQALPGASRREYENLRVDAMVFYHRELVASSGPDYDAKVTERWSDELPWESRLDDEPLQLIHREPLDQDYVSLRFPIAEYARRIGEMRAKAKDIHGKGSGQDFAWKQQANTMYGVLVCPHHPTNNVVAGNVITAQARAEAFAIMQALNGIQVITDGCSYRRDRIPACTFAECLRIMPDYTLRHADEDSGIPFLDPSQIPEDDQEFTSWYRDHMKRFFEVDGDEYDRLLSIHALEHKKTGSEKLSSRERGSFDAMCCDGSGNYIKLRRSEDGWAVDECKMRGYGRDSKAVLERWIPQAYSTDTMESLPPITSDSVLLKLNRAKQQARKAMVHGQIPAVYLPLSLEMSTIRCFKVIKPSAFVFQTPSQRKLVMRQIEKFQRATGCGLDLLVLRWPKDERARHSITAVAEDLYAYIQDGGRDLTKKFNLKVPRSQRERQLVEDRRKKLQQLKDQADRELFARIDVAQLSEDEILTGIIVTPENRHLVE